MIHGILHSLPRLICQIDVTFAPPSRLFKHGTWPSSLKIYKLLVCFVAVFMSHNCVVFLVEVLLVNRITLLEMKLFRFSVAGAMLYGSISVGL